MSETASGSPRVRWGWIVGCVALGLTAIGGGYLLTAPADRRGFVASVLAGVGTTLLLVGIVVLLERRILDSAASLVRQAVESEQAASAARIDRLVDGLEQRLEAEWSADKDLDVAAMRRRTAELTEDAVDQIVEEATRASERGARHTSS